MKSKIMKVLEEEVPIYKERFALRRNWRTARSWSSFVKLFVRFVHEV